MTPRDHPKVFISYIHDSPEHCESVREFATFLRSGQGIDAVLDQWVTERRQDWQAWAMRNILESDFVIVVASEGYRRVGDGFGPNDRNLGGQAEAATLRDLLQGNREDWTRKLLPVVLPGHRIEEIPQFLQPRAADHYIIESFTPEGTDELLRHLTRQPRHLLPPLGKPPVLPPLSGTTAPDRAPDPTRPVGAGKFPVVWRADLLRDGHQPQSPLVELALVPAEPVARHGVRDLERVRDELAASGRARQLFSPAQSVSVGSSAEAAWAVSTEWRSGEGGIAVLRGGQRTCWFALPKGAIGWLLDRDDLALQLADRLDLLLRIDLPHPAKFAPAIALDPVSLTRLGTPAEASATRAPLPLGVPERIRVDADDVYTSAELARSPHGVAEELTARLVAGLER